MKPACQICYHNMKPDGTDPHKFQCSLTHKIYFVPSEPGEKETITQNSIGAKEDYKYWSSDALQILWAVRWTPKGLQTKTELKTTSLKT